MNFILFYPNPFHKLMVRFDTSENRCTLDHSRDLSNKLLYVFRWQVAQLRLVVSQSRVFVEVEINSFSFCGYLVDCFRCHQSQNGQIVLSNCQNCCEGLQKLLLWTVNSIFTTLLEIVKIIIQYGQNQQGFLG